jgi:hypothetical protein
VLPGRKDRHHRYRYRLSHPASWPTPIHSHRSMVALRRASWTRPRSWRGTTGAEYALSWRTGARLGPFNTG